MSFDIIHLSEIDSTQDETLRRIRAGAKPGVVVMADVQTKGRGRRNREWQSSLGNLFATVSLPLGPDDPSGDYAFIVALAVHDSACAAVTTPNALKLKWPNDLMLNNAKCAGILLERPDPALLLIGVGMNIVHAPQDRAKLADIGCAVAPRALLDLFLAALTQRIGQYHDKGLPDILADWSVRADGVGEPITVNLPRTTKQGVFAGINNAGALLLRHESGEIETIYAGDVFFGV